MRKVPPLLAVVAAVFTVIAPVVFWSGSPAAADDGSRLVAVTDQDYDNHANARIRLFDPAVADWTSAAAQKWSWHPTAGNGFSGLTGAFGLPTDVKLRKDAGGNYVTVLSDSLGLAALIAYPAGTRIWAADVGSVNNPHSVELLPDGNVVVAASTGGFIRVYAASQGSASTRYAEFGLTGAHGVLWDPAGSVLWALGDTILVELKVDGTAAAPALTAVDSWTLPTVHGHDLSPKLGDPDRLWVTTGSAWYEYSKTTQNAVAAYDIAGVKSMSSMPNGRWVQTLPKPGCRTSWCTDEVDLTAPTAAYTVPGAQFYKARVWSSQYQ